MENSVRRITTKPAALVTIPARCHEIPILVGAHAPVRDSLDTLVAAVGPVHTGSDHIAFMIRHAVRTTGNHVTFVVVAHAPNHLYGLAVFGGKAPVHLGVRGVLGIGAQHTVPDRALHSASERGY